MPIIVFNGWDTGMKKIPFIHLLREKAGMSLAEAKKLKDTLVNDDREIEIDIENAMAAKAILDEARKLKVRGYIK